MAAAEREGDSEVGAGFETCPAPKPVTRKLTEAEQAVRLANVVLDRPGIDPDGDLTILARQLLRQRELLPMSIAPRDGTHILAYLHSDPDDCGYRGFGEWREIWWKPYENFGCFMPWHAGDPFDSHSGNEAPEHFGEAIPIAWMPLPENPNGAR